MPRDRFYAVNAHSGRSRRHPGPRVDARPLARAIDEYGASIRAVAELSGLSADVISRIVGGQHASVAGADAERLLIALDRPDLAVEVLDG